MPATLQKAANFLISVMGWLGLRPGNRYGSVALSFMFDSSERVGADRGATDLALWPVASPGLTRGSSSSMQYSSVVQSGCLGSVEIGRNWGFWACAVRLLPGPPPRLLFPEMPET